jgi:hypothetical protein
MTKIKLFKDVELLLENQNNSSEQIKKWLRKSDEENE